MLVAGMRLDFYYSYNTDWMKCTLCAVNHFDVRGFHELKLGNNSLHSQHLQEIFKFFRRYCHHLQEILLPYSRDRSCRHLLEILLPYSGDIATIFWRCYYHIQEILPQSFGDITTIFKRYCHHL